MNTIIAFNSATHEGGGVFCRTDTSPLFVNCVVWGNSAPNGGGFLSLSPPFVWNSIVWANNPTQIGGATDVVYSNVQGGWNGEGNIDLDPAFVDPTTFDFHLLDGSPCLNVGSNDAPMLPTFDIDGDPRVLETVVDMGADERGFNVRSVFPNHSLFLEDKLTVIEGSCFGQTGGIDVCFGEQSASNVVWLSENEILCVAPAGVEDTTVDITVSQSGERALFPTICSFSLARRI